MNYYNEIDPFAAAWLRELIKAGHISQGEVDERSIEDIVPSDLRGFKQCHFFAGIGGWSYALRLAGWPDDREVWTGSCPCQPFSAAGKRKGIADERHLWPAFFHLIGQRKPPIVFGEQVASKDGLQWFDLVQADMETAGYAVGAADLCAAGFGAPHIRQRLYFVADSASLRFHERWQAASLEIQGQCTERSGEYPEPEYARELSGRPEGLRGLGGLEHAPCEQMGFSGCARESRSSDGDVDNTPDQRLPERPSQAVLGGEARCEPERSSYVGGFWRNAEWIPCRDGLYRAIEPGTFPLVNGAPNRVGRLRGYGNAIVAPQAAAFISAAMECL